MISKENKQLPLNSRRNSLPVKRIDGSRLMCHEYATRALVELMQSGHTPSGADPVLPHAPQACKRIAVVTTVGWPARPPQRLVPVCTCRRALLRPVEATAVGADDSLLAGVAQAGHHWMEILPPPLRLQMGDALGEDCGGALRDRAHATAPPPGGDPAPGARAAPRLAFAALVACARTRAQGSGGPARALGVAPPARPGQGTTPEAGCICREQHARTAAGPGRAGRACERRPRALRGVGSAPARGPAGAAGFFFTRHERAHGAVGHRSGGRKPWRVPDNSTGHGGRRAGGGLGRRGARGGVPAHRSLWGGDRGGGDPPSLGPLGGRSAGPTCAGPKRESAARRPPLGGGALGRQRARRGHGGRSGPPWAACGRYPRGGEPERDSGV
jgi:hypothetical protein